MKFKFLIALAFASASVLFFVGNLQAQKLMNGGKPKEASVEGFDGAYCIDLSGSFEVCKAANYEREETKFVVRKNNENLEQTDAPYYSMACCGLEDFNAYRGDLDKDGFKEIVIVSLEGISNGMGIPSYDVHIFRDPTKFPSEKPLIFPLQEFGEKGNFIFDTKARETQILVTYWNDFNNLDPKRGNGTYLVGKWFRYRNGLLEPVFEKPTLARRFLYSFADEMNKTGENPFAPYLWLKSKNTHKFFTEPRETSKLIATQYGTIKSYKRNDETDERRLMIEMDSGEMLKGIYAYNSRRDEKEPNTVYLTDIGSDKQNYFFPFEFNPLVYFEKIEGKKVRLKTYKDEYSNESTKLWILK